MNIRQELCNEARTWEGTKWQHQAMVKGVGVDCAMLIAGIAINVGLVEKSLLKKVPSYPMQWHINQDFPLLEKIMTDFGCVKKDDLEFEPGDIVVFQFGRVPSHLGMVLDDKLMIHAYQGTLGKTVINSISGQWIDRLRSVYTLPGV